MVMAMCLSMLSLLGLKAQERLLPPNPFGNALVPDMIADASIQEIDGVFYCYATTDGYGRGLETSGPPTVWTSRDFVNWSFDGTYFPSAATQKYWAPSKVVRANSRYYIYPTINAYIYPAVADSPLGPFRLARGNDAFSLPFTSSTLFQSDNPEGIDAEVFVDDDGQPYVFWGRNHAARLRKDMVSIDSVVHISTPQNVYSEGPIFFKRNGIYYYLYTLGGDERYQYAYGMSKVSPLGPFVFPDHNVIATTDYEQGIFGPGHGSVFTVDGTHDYYFAYLEFGRRSTNRQTYVSRMEFNDDGTIRPIQLTMQGVGALGGMPVAEPISVKDVTASSTAAPLRIRPMKDDRLNRTEHFVPAFAADGANGSRWMAAADDPAPTITIDLGEVHEAVTSQICFVRPTAGHAYTLQRSTDGTHWETCGGHDDLRKMSPHTDLVGAPARYLRVSILQGVAGVWEWKVYDGEMAQPHTWGRWDKWGDQADGTYLNPVIPADFSDLDCIRVGNDYYAISSTFQFSPGMTILHSTDLVNWEYCGNAVDDLTRISPEMNWTRMNRYGRGIWAGTLRHHANRFYLFFGTPDEGFFMTSAPEASGPWQPLTCLLPEGGWDDCTAFWDDNGKAYFVGTHFSDGYKTYLFDMSADGKTIDRQSARLINEGSGREANKLIKVGDWYYLVFSEHKNGIGRYVMAKRARQITGPYAEEKQLALPNVDACEPNQGGIVEGDSGRWYFLTHHGTGDWSGRVASLLPVTWKDGWPMIGCNRPGSEGAMQWSGDMPFRAHHKLSLTTTDHFDSSRLASQWQWNHQPRTKMFSLTKRKGWLRLKAFRPLKENDLMTAGNTLTQRTFRTPANKVTIKMDISGMENGQHAGLCHFSASHSALGIYKDPEGLHLEYRENDACRKEVVDLPAVVYLRSEWGLDGLSYYSYSTDGHNYISVGHPYQLSWGNYRGDRIGIYNFNDLQDKGYVDVDYLQY